MGTIAVIVVACVLGFVAFALLMKAVSAGVGAKVRTIIAARYPKEAIVLQDELANNFGRTSKGKMQLRGNGGLVLTRDTLHFLPIIGEELHIPLTEVTGVSTVKSHLGKSVFRPLLKVDYAGDAVAFFVMDVERWKTALTR